MPKRAAKTSKERGIFALRSEVIQYPGMAGWFFISVPKKQSAEIRLAFSKQKRGWGSLPVEVTLGKTVWKTSIFPDKKSGCYVLPLKTEIRKRERVAHGDVVRFRIHLQA